MKYISILFIICASYNFVCAQTGLDKNNFILKGKIQGRTSGLMYINYLDKNEHHILDSCNIKNGAFSFTGVINGALLADIYGKETASSTKKLNTITLYLEPDTVEIWINEVGFKLKGAHTQNQKDERSIWQKTAYKALDSIVKQQDSIRILIKKGDKSIALISKQKMLQDKRSVINEQEKKIDYDFMKANPKSYLNPQILSYYFGSKKLSLDSTEMMFRQFDTLVQNSTRGKILMREINGRKNSSTGQIAPLFVRTDINGDEISLSSFRGKNYVILDFWASWCVPCRKFTPTMKSFYQKYHSKGLEIISLSWDSDTKAWKDAIKEDGMDAWKNILTNMYLPQDNSMRDKYSIPSIPLLILIDKKGVIIGRYMAPKEDGGQSELEKKLEEIFSTP